VSPAIMVKLRPAAMYSGQVGPEGVASIAGKAQGRPLASRPLTTAGGMSGKQRLSRHPQPRSLRAEPAAHDARKQTELAPYIEAALKRKKWTQPPAQEVILPIPTYGRSVVAGGTPNPIAARRGGGINIPSEDPSEGLCGQR
jgi:hypothetical protein